MFGTGNDLNTGSFVTLNGKRWRESISDFKKAFAEANDMGSTKNGILFAWLTGNFDKDYDIAKNLDTDILAIKRFNAEFEKTDKKKRLMHLVNLKALLLRYKNLLKTPTKELLV